MATPAFRTPDRAGPAGRAWLRRCTSPHPDHQASIASWVVNRPGAHPFWSWWCVSIVHLRDIPGVKPAHKRFAEATHEFMICSVNPEEWPHGLSTADDLEIPFLQPLDVCEQVAGIDDEGARKLCELAVRAIVAGHLSPDQDHRAMWRAAIASTVEHIVAGKHGGDA